MYNTKLRLICIFSNFYISCNEGSWLDIEIGHTLTVS